MTRTSAQAACRASVGVALALLVSACGQPVAVPAAAPTPGGSPTASASPTPTDSTPLLTGFGLVVDSGSGTHLCLGAVTMDTRSDCGNGVPVTGWMWPREGTERSGSDYTSGSFTVVGTYDGKQFHLDASVPPDPKIPPPTPGQFSSESISVCPPPNRGWPSNAPPGADDDSESAVLALAGQLPGYGGSWVDKHNDSRNASYSTHTQTFNVLVTRDVAGAERRLREVWPGSLCVGLTKHPMAELEEINKQLWNRTGFVGGGIGLQSRDGKDTGTMVVQADVVYDDGTLQRQLDEKHGDDVVEVTSVLRPYRA